VTQADVAVIGSGAAGAVVAARLAERGARVSLFEEGPVVRPEDQDGDLLRAIRTAYRNGGALLSIGVPSFPVQVGRCVGGSTTINGGTCFRTPDGVLTNWSRALDGAITPADMTPYFEQVEGDLGVAEVSPELAFAGERRLVEAAHARGDVAGYVKRNARACQGTGLCPFGCPTGAKQSMDVSYIPRAERAGAALQAGTRVDRILVQGGRATGVRATSPKSGTFNVEADAVVLCAGALHSPLLLRRSLGRHAPSATGRNLSLHPGAHVFGILPEDLEPRDGPIQSIYIEGSDADYVIFGMSYPPEVLGAMLVGQDAKLSHLALYPRTVTVAVMASDRHASGRVRRMPGGGPLPLYDLDDDCRQSLVSGIAHASELLLDIGAVEVHHGVRRMPPFTRQAEIDAFRRDGVDARRLVLGSVHPMGTCRMGLDPTTSVVDADHGVHGIDRLYVPDASFFPTSIGVNPQLTINAFAMRCADRIAEALGDRVNGSASSRGANRPRDRVRERLSQIGSGRRT
jgi:choline dehydrogenase-like flavoprotein